MVIAQRVPTKLELDSPTWIDIHTIVDASYIEEKTLASETRIAKEKKYSAIMVHAQNKTRTLGDNPKNITFNDSFQAFQGTVHMRVNSTVYT
jgi:hypothetical protein